MGAESAGVKLTSAEARRGGEGDDGGDEVLARLSSESSIELELERARLADDVDAASVDVISSGSRVALQWILMVALSVRSTTQTENL